MLSIQHPYISVAVYGGASYGGGQQFSENAMIRRCGCGIVAATDLLLYLSRWHMTERVPLFDGLPLDAPVPFPVYTGLLSKMNRRYLPMIPYAGINGVMLMLGVQRFFHDYKMPFTARWCFAQSRLWERIEAMLMEDLPVIMAVGPNFPFIWGDKRAAFYRMQGWGLCAYRGRPCALFHRDGHGRRVAAYLLLGQALLSETKRI